MPRSTQVIRTGTAQANTGQTDLVHTPGFANKCVVYLDITATAGNTPLTDMKFQYVDPAGNATDFQWNGITQVAGTPSGPIVVGIGYEFDTEDDTTPIYLLKDPLPDKWNIVLTFDRTTGNETYTYTLTCEFFGE